MHIFLPFFQRLKNIKNSELFYIFIFFSTLFLIFITNNIFRDSNIYGSDIFYQQTSSKTVIFYIFLYYLIFNIFFFLKQKFLLIEKKSIFIWIFFLIILYKIYLYRFPFDFGPLDIHVEQYFVKGEFNYYKSIFYFIYYLELLFDNSKYLFAKIQVLFSLIAIIIINYISQKYNKPSDFKSYFTIILLILYMPWNMVETMIGPDVLFNLIFYTSIYLILNLKNENYLVNTIILNLLFALGCFTKDTFFYISLILIFFILFTEFKRKFIISIILLINIFIFSNFVTKINQEKYNVNSFYKNQVLLLKLMSYGYFNENLKVTYVDNLSDEARIFHYDIEKLYHSTITPHKREPFVNHKLPKFWINIRPDFENITRKGVVTRPNANLEKISKEINQQLLFKKNQGSEFLTQKEIEEMFRFSSEKLDNKQDKEMLKYIKDILIFEYINTKTCSNNINQTPITCIEKIIQTFDKKFITDRSNDWYYKRIALNQSVKFDQTEKKYTSHEYINTLPEILLQKPFLYISQSILSFFGNTGYVPTPTAMGKANSFFNDNNIPKFLTREFQKIFILIINYWYLFCLFSFIHAVFFLKERDLKSKNILFSILPLYFGLFLSFFSMGEVVRQMLLVIPFIFYNFLVVINFIFKRINYLLFGQIKI